MNIATFALLSIVAGVVLAPLLGLLIWLADGLRRRRRVLGSRVKAPEWRARRLTTGQWIVERRK